LKYFKNAGKEYIDPGKPKEVSLEIALREVDNLPVTEDDFIGFTNEKEATIQFIRFEPNGWLIDVPVIKDGDMPILSKMKT
jgi:hypothetical protein